MLNMFEVIETNNMIEHEKLDVERFLRYLTIEYYYVATFPLTS